MFGPLARDIPEMKVAIAGTGNVAQYLIEEFQKYGHNIRVLTRRTKPELNVEQRETSYSVNSLIEALQDCEALVSTVADFANPQLALKVHLDMIEACKQSKTCKTFVPSEWTSDVETYPEQPMFATESNEILHNRLKKETGLRWTIICNSWFADYVLPQSQRHLRDVGPIWPMDYTSKVFTIFGPGTQVNDFASARDVAKAVAVLLDSKAPWEPYTFVSGDRLSWNDLYAIIKQRDPEWKSQNKPLADTIRQVIANESPESTLLGQFELLSYSGASAFNKEKVERHRSKYFPNLHFRSVREILETGEAYPGSIV